MKNSISKNNDKLNVKPIKTEIMKKLVKELVKKKYDVNNVVPTYFRDTEVEYVKDIFDELFGECEFPDVDEDSDGSEWIGYENLICLLIHESIDEVLNNRITEIQKIIMGNSERFKEKNTIELYNDGLNLEYCDEYGVPFYKIDDILFDSGNDIENIMDKTEYCGVCVEILLKENGREEFTVYTDRGGFMGTLYEITTIEETIIKVNELITKII